MTVIISGAALVAAFGVVAVLCGWLVVALFRVSRGQPAGRRSDQPG
jgi:hypothetical protein